MLQTSMDGLGRLVQALARRPRTSARSSSRSSRAAARGDVRVDYAPRADGVADPGEVCWAWVPFEENDGRGKDRPVLVLARRGDGVLQTLMLTSKDHDRDAAQEAHWGRYWMDVGTGPWDPRGRPSEVRLDRLIELAPDAVRREGAALPRAVFDRVVAAARAHHALG
ncbi:MAG: type II toxin-antitoxin system PemK/MazF family toxin [Nocardioides sp.]